MLMTISILSCVICIVVKWFFAFMASRQEQAISLERANYHSARKTLQLAVHRYKIATQELKQLEIKINMAQQNIGSLNRTHNDLNTQKIQVDSQIQKQKEMLKELREGSSSR